MTLADGPLVVAGPLGSGVTTLLRRRASDLSQAGRSVQELSVKDAAAFATSILHRHGRHVRVLRPAEQRALVANLLASTSPADWGDAGGDLGDRAFASEVATTVLAYQSSFLGIEELRVHADAAGVLERWEALARFCDRYLEWLAAHGAVDRAGVVVQASLLLRDREVLAAERARFDHLVVDDAQLLTFPSLRLLSQLVGPGGPVTFGGSPDGAVGTSGRLFAALARRFGAEEVVLVDRHREPGVPQLRIVEQPTDERVVARDVLRAAAEQGLRGRAVAFLRRTPAPGVDTLSIDAAVGREWPMVVVFGASDGVLPTARPAHRWFDPELLSGPDVPDDSTRERRWQDEERRRFAVACSRATRWLVVVGALPISPFVADLVR